MRKVFLIIIFGIICLCFPARVHAASEELLENPEHVYEQFLNEVYDSEYEVKYGFAREPAPVYGDRYGSRQIGMIEKFTGVIVVSETESYVQVIYHKEDQYDIGWIEQEYYKEEVKFYNGAEKQLFADGIYAMESQKEDRIYYVELIFEGDQQYAIRSIKRDSYLEVKYDKKGVAASHVPGHYMTIADYNEEDKTYLVLDSHPIPKRPTSSSGDWFPWEKLESGGLASSCYFIFEQNK